MARRDGPADDGAALREYLLEQAVEFREMYGQTSEMWTELSKPVDQLVGGEAFRLCGFQLPDRHPALAECGPNAYLILTADDRLLLHDDYHRHNRS